MCQFPVLQRTSRRRIMYANTYITTTSAPISTRVVPICRVGPRLDSSIILLLQSDTALLSCKQFQPASPVDTQCLNISTCAPVRYAKGPTFFGRYDLCARSNSADRGCFMRHSALSNRNHRPVRQALTAGRSLPGWAAALLVVLTVGGLSAPVQAAGNDVALCDAAVSLKLKKLSKTIAAVDTGFRQQWQAQRPDDKIVSCERYFMANEELRINRMAQFGEEHGVQFVVAPAVFAERGKTQASIWIVDVKNKAKRQSLVVDLPSNAAKLRRDGESLLVNAIPDLSASLPGRSRAAATPTAAAPSPAVGAADGKTLVCDFAVSIKLKGLQRPLGLLYDEFARQWKSARSQDVFASCKRYFMANEELRINKMASFGSDIGAQFVIAPGVSKDNDGVNRLSVWKIDVNNKTKVAEAIIEIPTNAAAIAAQASQVAEEAVGRMALGRQGPGSAPSQPVEVASSGPRVVLCDAAVSVKLKDIRSDIQALESEIQRLWNTVRPADQAMQCRRYFMEKPAIRLNKLVSFGEKAKVDYVFAPAVYEEADQSVRISIWIVDVAAQRALAEVLVPLPAKGDDIRQNGPTTMVRPLTELRAVLEARLAGRALPKVSTYAPPPATATPTLVSARPTAGVAERTDTATSDVGASGRSAPLMVAQANAELLAPGPNAVGAESLPVGNPATLEGVTSVSPAPVSGSSSAPMMRMVMINSAGALLGAGLAATATAAGLTGVAMSLNQFKDQARLEQGDYEQLQGMVMGVSAGADASWAAAGIAGAAGVALLSGTLLWVEE